MRHRGLQRARAVGYACIIVGIILGLFEHNAAPRTARLPKPALDDDALAAASLAAQTELVERLTSQIQAEDVRISQMERQLADEVSAVAPGATTSGHRLLKLPVSATIWGAPNSARGEPGGEDLVRLGPMPAGFPAREIERCSAVLPEQAGTPVNESDLYQCREADVALIHIPKTGGTSIEHAGHRSKLGLRWGFQYERDRFRKIRRNLPRIETKIPLCLGNWGKKCCSWWHIPPRQMLDWRPYFGAPNRFCVVRDPYARVLSEYSFSHGKEIRKLPCDQLNRTEVNEWLRDRMMQYVNGALTISDCHWIPQYQYIEPHVGILGATVDSTAGTPDPYIDAGPDGRSCNKVIRLDKLATEFPALMDEYGIPEVQLQKGKKAFTSLCKDVAMLDDDTRRLIRRIYMQDFVQFGYPS